MKNILALFFLLFSSVYSQQYGLQPLTSHYKPTEWKLFDFYPNPSSPVYSTELCVPDSAKIEVNIYKKDVNNNYWLIRNHVNRDRFYFKPAIYKLDWSLAQDSLDLPVVDGYYKIIVKAFSKSLDQILYTDSITSLVHYGWQDSGVYVEDNDWTLLDSTRINDNLEIEKFTYAKIPSPIITIPSIRFKNRIEGITEAQLAIRFILNNEKDKSHRYFVDLYSAKKDTNSNYGIKIVKKLGYLWDVDFSKVFNLNDYELLIIDYIGYDPIVLDLKNVFKRYL